MRVSQNVIFIETPSVAPSLDARGFDDGEFTYDNHDDMLRDVRNYTSNHSADSLSPERAVGDAVGNLSPIELLEKNCETTNRDLGLHLLDLLLPMMRLGLLVVRLRKIVLPLRGKSVPRCRSTMRLLLDLHLVRRRRLVHRPLVLLCLVLRRRVVLSVDAVRLVVDEVPRRRLQSPGLLRVVDLRGEASRSAVDVAAGLHVDVVLVVDEVPRRRLQPPGLLRPYPMQRPSASFVASPTRLP